MARNAREISGAVRHRQARDSRVGASPGGALALGDSACRVSARAGLSVLGGALGRITIGPADGRGGMLGVLPSRMRAPSIASKNSVAEAWRAAGSGAGAPARPASTAAP